LLGHGPNPSLWTRSASSTTNNYTASKALRGRSAHPAAHGNGCELRGHPVSCAEGCEAAFPGGSRHGCQPLSGATNISGRAGGEEASHLGTGRFFEERKVGSNSFDW